MSKRDIKRFFLSMFTTLCVIAFVFGFYAVDINTRAVGFDDPSARYSYAPPEIKDGTLSNLFLLVPVYIRAGYDVYMRVRDDAADLIKNLLEFTENIQKESYGDAKLV